MKLYIQEPSEKELQTSVGKFYTKTSIQTNLMRSLLWSFFLCCGPMANPHTISVLTRAKSRT